jgi:hypothetical protein
MKKHEFSGVIRGFLCTFLGCKRGVTLVIRGSKRVIFGCFWGRLNGLKRSLKGIVLGSLFGVILGSFWKVFKGLKACLKVA